MAKGKTNQPVSIVVHSTLLDTPEIEKLREQGNTILPMADLAETCWLIGPNCWRMTPDLIKYLPLMLKAARAEKRERKAKGTKEQCRLTL